MTSSLKKSFLQKIKQGNLSLLAIVFVSAAMIFTGGARAEAASQMWWYQTLDYVGGCDADGACSFWPSNPPTYTKVATFYAATDKDVYAPGETGTIIVSATNGQADPNTRGLNAVWCLLGCGSVPAVGVSASGAASASCSATGSCSSTTSFVAPSVPGDYPISLNGCYYTGSQCAGSGMSIRVAAPPSVFLQFSFLDKVKNILSDPAHLFDALKQAV